MIFEKGNAPLRDNCGSWYSAWQLACGILLSSVFIFHVSTVLAQHLHHHQPTRTKRTPEIKPDRLTLRYKPQSGTLLYDIHTEVGQHVSSDHGELSGNLSSDAQLAFHTLSIDYKKGVWSFDQFFTNFQIKGREFWGDSLLLHENMAVNRITRLTYDLTGKELSKRVKDTLKLLNAEAQTNAYFFEPPRMIIPLPEHYVTYGDTWIDHTRDSVGVRDTVNIGTTTGAYIYDITRTFRLASLHDTLDQYFAIIVVKDSGTFEGWQTNSITHVTTTASGPISGTDTTLLDLFLGRVVRRTLNMSIPTVVKLVASHEDNTTSMPFADMIDVRSVVKLDESNVSPLSEGKKQIPIFKP